MADDRDRYNRDRYDRDRFEDRTDRDRGALARAGDEVRSWFGDDDARRRRERDERHDVRGYGTDPQFGDRDYGRSDRGERWSGDRWSGEPARTETYRDFGDRYGRSYSAPIDRDRETTRATRYGSYSGSQEFGPEGYGAVGRYGSGAGYGREWGSTERWRVPGPYVGRGPKGYQRSDERIREDISERLTAHGLIDASDVEVRVQGAEVTLIGFVDSREAKRAAEDCAEDVSGVREVHNQLRIRTHADDVGTGRTSVLGLTEKETQTTDVARRADAPTTSRAR
jgi:hypothetical protein